MYPVSAANTESHWSRVGFSLTKTSMRPAVTLLNVGMRSSADRARQTFAVIFFALLAPAAASLPPSGDSAPQPQLAQVVDWVLTTGVQTVVRANITRAAGLGKSDVAVRERAFRVQGRQYTDVAAVATELRDLVILARVNESDGSAIVWRTSSSGKLVGTVSFIPPAEPTLIEPSPVHNAQFEALKHYFRLMMTIKAAPPRAPL